MNFFTDVKKLYLKPSQGYTERRQLESKIKAIQVERSLNHREYRNKIALPLKLYKLK